MTNCPNCAAPLKGGRCGYCGTQVEQPRRVLVPESHSYITMDAHKIQIGVVNMADMEKAREIYHKIVVNQS